MNICLTEHLFYDTMIVNNWDKTQKKVVNK